MSLSSWLGLDLPAGAQWGFFENYLQANLDDVLESYGFRGIVQFQLLLAVATVALVGFERWRLARNTRRQLQSCGLAEEKPEPPRKEKPSAYGGSAGENMMAAVLNSRQRRQKADATPGPAAVQEEARRLLSQMDQDDLHTQELAEKLLQQMDDHNPSEARRAEADEDEEDGEEDEEEDEEEEEEEEEEEDEEEEDEEDEVEEKELREDEARHEAEPGQAAGPRITGSEPEAIAG
eukprot:s3577_g3.t1